MMRWDVINHLIRKNNYHSYLEIGVQARQTFDKVVITSRFGVDPMPMKPVDFLGTSDKFFEQNERQFDIVFIDGDHRAEQAYKDIINSQKCLTEKGTIVLHDCNPTSEKMQRPKRVTSQWTGDVWKAYYSYRSWLDLDCFVVDTDWGLGVISWNKQAVGAIFGTGLTNGIGYATQKDFNSLTYSDLNMNRKQWLNLISVEEFLTL